MKGALALRYGRTQLFLDPGALGGARILAAKVPEPAASPDELVSRRLARPTGSPPLREILAGAGSVAIPISDVTRYSATEVFLPHLLRETDAAGIPRNRVALYVARGTHRALSREEILAVAGPEVASGIRVEQSDPDGETVRLGTTSRGTPVLVCRSLMEHDRIVLTGTISFHYFAGFGGGRKALVPGCAARETAQATHYRIFLPDHPGKHPLARSGILDGNPVHEDIVESVSLARPAFLFNTLLTPGKKMFDAVAGDWRKAHEEGCARYAGAFRVAVPERSPLVIASAGGYPKDINFIQSHKALDNAFRAVAKGGTLILLAECPDGFGSPQFFPWFRFSDLAAMEKELRANYQIYGQTAHATLAKSGSCRVVLVSSLRPEDVTRMGMIPAASLEEALAATRALLGELPPALVIPDAGYVLPDPEK